MKHHLKMHVCACVSVWAAELVQHIWGDWCVGSAGTALAKQVRRTAFNPWNDKSTTKIDFTKSAFVQWPPRVCCGSQCPSVLKKPSHGQTYRSVVKHWLRVQKALGSPSVRVCTHTHHTQSPICKKKSNQNSKHPITQHITYSKIWKWSI